MSELEVLRQAAEIERQRDSETGRELLEADWLVIAKGKRLHHAALSDDQCVELVRWGPIENVQLTCGRTTKWAAIGGLFDRLGCERCGPCCKAVGFPPGRGSPKNDPACKADAS